MGQKVEGGRLDGHIEQVGLPPGGSEEPLQVFEQGRDTVRSAHFLDGCDHSMEARLGKLQRRPGESVETFNVVPTRDAECLDGSG